MILHHSAFDSGAGVVVARALLLYRSNLLVECGVSYFKRSGAACPTKLRIIPLAQGSIGGAAGAPLSI